MRGLGWLGWSLAEDEKKEGGGKVGHFFLSASFGVFRRI